MSKRFVKWKTDLEKSVIVENFEEEHFLRSEESTFISNNARWLRLELLLVQCQ